MAFFVTMVLGGSNLLYFKKQLINGYKTFQNRLTAIPTRSASDPEVTWMTNIPYLVGIPLRTLEKLFNTN